MSKDPHRRHARRDRRLKIRILANVALASLLAVLFAVLVNYGMSRLARDRSLRIDLTRGGTHSLDPGTLDVVDDLDRRIDVYLVVSERSPSILQAARRTAVSQPDSGLLEKQYRPFLRFMLRRSAMLVGEAHERNPLLVFHGAEAASERERPRKWARALELSAEELVNHLVFHDPSSGAKRSFDLFEVFETDLGGPMGSQLGHRPPRILGHHIDAFLRAGIRALTAGEKSRVALAAGHGELGLPTLERVFRALNAEVEVLEIGAATVLPASLDLLVVASPKRAWSPEERAELERWVRAGGRLLLLQGRDCAELFQELLGLWGIEPMSAQLRHPTWHLRQLGPYELRGSGLLRPAEGESAHAVSSYLVEQRLPLHLGFGRPYRLNEDYDTRRAARTALLRGGPEGVAMPWVKVGRSFKQAPERGTEAGDFALGFALERKGELAEEADTRVLVYGGDEWLAEGLLQGGYSLANSDLLRASARWLLGQEQKITGAPRIYRRYVVAMDEDEIFTFRVLTAGALPLLVLLIGALIHMTRRRS